MLRNVPTKDENVLPNISDGLRRSFAIDRVKTAVATPGSF